YALRDCVGGGPQALPCAHTVAPKGLGSLAHPLKPLTLPLSRGEREQKCAFCYKCFELNLAPMTLTLSRRERELEAHHLPPRGVQGWVREHAAAVGAGPQGQVGVKSVEGLLQLDCNILAIQLQTMQHLAAGITVPDDAVLLSRHAGPLHHQAQGIRRA